MRIGERLSLYQLGRSIRCSHRSQIFRERIQLIAEEVAKARLLRGLEDDDHSNDDFGQRYHYRP